MTLNSSETRSGTWIIMGTCLTSHWDTESECSLFNLSRQTQTAQVGELWNVAWLGHCVCIPEIDLHQASIVWLSSSCTVSLPIGSPCICAVWYNILLVWGSLPKLDHPRERLGPWVLVSVRQPPYTEVLHRLRWKIPWWLLIWFTE